VVAHNHFRFDGAWLEKPHHPASPLRRISRLRTKDGERVGVARRQHGIDSTA
jgi:hypothetical protein